MPSMFIFSPHTIVTEVKPVMPLFLFFSFPWAFSFFGNENSLCDNPLVTRDKMTWNNVSLAIKQLAWLKIHIWTPYVSLFTAIRYTSCVYAWRSYHRYKPYLTSLIYDFLYRMTSFTPFLSPLPYHVLYQIVDLLICFCIDWFFHYHIDFLLWSSSREKVSFTHIVYLSC